MEALRLRRWLGAAVRPTTCRWWPNKAAPMSEPYVKHIAKLMHSAADTGSLASDLTKPIDKLLRENTLMHARDIPASRSPLHRAFLMQRILPVF